MTEIVIGGKLMVERHYLLCVRTSASIQLFLFTSKARGVPGNDTKISTVLTDIRDSLGVYMQFPSLDAGFTTQRSAIPPKKYYN